MKAYLYLLITLITISFCSCSHKSSETHYADIDYSDGTNLETFDHNLAITIDEINRYNPFKTQRGAILRQVQMEDEAIVSIIELDDGVTAKDIDWKEFDKWAKDAIWEFLGEHSQRVKFFTQCALSGRYLIYEYYDGNDKVHTYKIWPGDYIEDIIY